MNSHSNGSEIYRASLIAQGQNSKLEISAKVGTKNLI